MTPSPPPRITLSQQGCFLRSAVKNEDLSLNLKQKAHLIARSPADQAEQLNFFVLTVVTS